MSNLMGKVLLEGKKVVDSISEVTVKAVDTVKEQSAPIIDKAKKSMEISMLKAEIDDLYKEFGKATFEWGLMPTNEKAMELMKVLYEKTGLLEELTKVEPVEEVKEDVSEDTNADEVTDKESSEEVNLDKGSDSDEDK